MPLKVISRNPSPHTLAEIIRALFPMNSPDFLAGLLDYLNLKNGILVGSGREALYYILKSLLNEDDEIILPAFSCNVLLGAINKASVKPIFADVSLESLNMELDQVKPLVTPRTKAVLVTHQFGYPANIDEIITYCLARNIVVIEDAAPAFGVKYRGKYVGTIGDVGFFSFQQSKVISTLDGGLIIGKAEILDKIKSRFPASSPHSSTKYFFETVKDYCLRNEYIYSLLLSLWGLFHQTYTIADQLDLDLARYTDIYKTLSKFQTNLGNQQLTLLENILQVRNEAARLYRQELAGLNSIICIPQSDLTIRSHTYSRFPILVTDKHLVYQKVKQVGVDLGFTFSYKLPQYFENDHSTASYPNTDFIIAHILNIPIHRQMMINYSIISKIKQALSHLDN
jgi:dTDP-4-amino-4,6-dideoxygalactose transaminase